MWGPFIGAKGSPRFLFLRGQLKTTSLNKDGDWIWHVICLKAGVVIFYQGVRSMKSQQFIAKYAFHVETAI